MIFCLLFNPYSEKLGKSRRLSLIRNAAGLFRVYSSSGKHFGVCISNMNLEYSKCNIVDLLFEDMLLDVYRDLSIKMTGQRIHALTDHPYMNL